jgi:hypothetical protein
MFAVRAGLKSINVFGTGLTALSRVGPTRRAALVLWLALFAASAQAARAQSSIFNAPSTDVMPPHTLYVEADYIAHATSYEKGGFQFFGPSVVYGVRKNFEVGVNAYFTRSSAPTAAELQPNAKWQFFSDESRGLAAAAGGILFVPLTRRAEAKTNAMLYAAVSKQLKARLGPRLTTGAYRLVGRVGEGETRGGVLLGYEQPVSRRLSFLADWYSGHNSYGYAAAGASFALSKRDALYVGYSFGNRGRGNNWLGLFYGRTF